MASDESSQPPKVPHSDLAQPLTKSVSAQGDLAPNAAPPLAASQSAPVAVDEAISEADEGYAHSLSGSDLTSIASNIRKGVLENGRIYPNFGKNEYGVSIRETRARTTGVLRVDKTTYLGTS